MRTLAMHSNGLIAACHWSKEVKKVKFSVMLLIYLLVNFSTLSCTRVIEFVNTFRLQVAQTRSRMILETVYLTWSHSGECERDSA